MIEAKKVTAKPITAQSITARLISAGEGGIIPPISELFDNGVLQCDGILQINTILGLP